MLMLLRLSLVCILSAFSLAVPAPISPSRSGKWILSHAQRLPQTAKSRILLYNTRLRRSKITSLRKRDLPESPALIPSHYAMYAFLQAQKTAHKTVRRTHACSLKEYKISRPSVAIRAGRLTDHRISQPRTASQTKYPGLNTASLTHSFLQKTRMLNSKIGQYAGRRAALMEISKNFVRFVPKSLSTANRVGLTGERCTTSFECAGGRICVEGSTSTCPAGEKCFCAPADGFDRCTSSDDCSTAGEVCVQLTKSTVCLSQEAANAAGIPIVGSVSPGNGGDTLPAGNTEPDAGSGNGITGTTCANSSECAGGRICVEGSTASCPAGDKCFCAPADGFDRCTSSDDCSTAGEVCVQLTKSTVCFSQEAASAAGIPVVGDESPGDDGGAGAINIPIDVAGSGGDNDGNDKEVCIDARALGHISTNGLVFEKHAVSRVLCDENNSCATRGHMVVFRGHAMRMSTYCDSVDCKEAVIEVNSPHFNRRMRIESNTKGLEYTAFAARYDTQAEESLIRMAIHLGL